jgi:hypothetical protein
MAAPQKPTQPGESLIDNDFDVAINPCLNVALRLAG